MSPQPWAVLLIDDSLEDRYAFRRFLEQDPEQSFICYEAASAAEGLARCRELLPDAVLLDYHLPDDEGLALLSTLINEHGRNAFAMLLLTGAGNEQLAVQAMKLGAHDYLVKGLHLQHQLGRAVVAAIERAHLQRELDASNALLLQSKNALQSERDRFVTLVETVPGVVCAYRQRPDGTVSFPYASPRITEIYGLSPEALANDASGIINLWHPDDVARLRDSIEASQQQLTPWSIEFRVRHPIRGELWIGGSAIPQREADGSTIWYGLLTDITERKHAEQAQRRAADRLHILAEASRAFAEAGQEYQSILTLIARVTSEQLDTGTMITMLSDDGAWLQASTHYDPDTAVRAMIQQLFGQLRLSIQAPAAIATVVRQKLPLLTPHIDPAAIRATVTEDQRAIFEKLHPHSSIIVPLQAHGQAFGALSLMRYHPHQPPFGEEDLALAQDLADRTALAISNARLFIQVRQELAERQLVEAALEAQRATLARRVEERTADLSIANAELARAARLKDEFLANMSHELRTPLNSILGRSQALQEEIYGPIVSEQSKALDAIETSGRHLLALINDILDLSKIEADKLELQIEPVALDLLCLSALQMVTQLAIQKRRHAFLHARQHNRDNTCRRAPPQANPGQPALKRHQVHPRRWQSWPQRAGRR